MAEKHHPTKPNRHMVQHPLHTSENSENNGVYHLFLYLDTAKGEKGGFHVNTPLKSIKMTYESYDFSVFGRTKNKTKKMQCMNLPRACYPHTGTCDGQLRSQSPVGFKHCKSHYNINRSHMA